MSLFPKKVEYPFKPFYRTHACHPSTVGVNNSVQEVKVKPSVRIICTSFLNNLSTVNDVKSPYAPKLLKYYTN